MKKMIVGMAGVVLLLSGMTAVWAEESKAAAVAPAVKAESAAPAAAPAVKAESAAPAAAPKVAAEAKPVAEAPAVAAEPSVEASNLEVAEASIATGIENRAPVGAAENFTAGAEKLYCYSKITGGKPGDKITHRWSKDGQTIAEVTLNIGGSPWRVHSSKMMESAWTGKFAVEIMQADKVLKKLEFTIEPGQAGAEQSKPEPSETGKTQTQE